MGQYYKIINLTKKEYLEPYGGVKLMEFSWCFNNTTTHLTNLLANEWFGDQVICAGDYTESDYFQSYKPDAKVGEYGEEDIYEYATRVYTCINKDREKYSDWSDKGKHIKMAKKYDYVINMDTKEYMRFSDLPGKLEYYQILPSGSYHYLGTDDKYKTLVENEPEYYTVVNRKVYAPSLLITTSNGGGGSYYGSDIDSVGRWMSPDKGHSICVCKDEKDCKLKIPNWEDYKQIYPNFIE